MSETTLELARRIVEGAETHPLGAIPADCDRVGVTVTLARALLAHSFGPSSDDAACERATALLRAEIERLEYPKSMIPQEAKNIERRQEAFEAAIRFLNPVSAPQLERDK